MSSSHSSENKSLIAKSGLQKFTPEIPPGRPRESEQNKESQVGLGFVCPAFLSHSRLNTFSLLFSSFTLSIPGLNDLVPSGTLLTIPQPPNFDVNTYPSNFEYVLP